MTDEDRATIYAEQVSVSHRVHADMFIGRREFSSVSSIVYAAYLDGLRAAREGRPRVVCLCGSTKFKEAFEAAELTEGLAGHVVLTVAAFGHRGDLPPEACVDGHPTKVALDELHKRKIEMADEVLVINVDGYVGNSTRSEIAYALSQKKLVRYLEVPNFAVESRI